MYTCTGRHTLDFLSVFCLMLIACTYVWTRVGVRKALGREGRCLGSAAGQRSVLSCPPCAAGHGEGTAVSKAAQVPSAQRKPGSCKRGLPADAFTTVSAARQLQSNTLCSPGAVSRLQQERP